MQSVVSFWFSSSKGSHSRIALTQNFCPDKAPTTVAVYWFGTAYAYPLGEIILCSKDILIPSLIPGNDPAMSIAILLN